MHRDVTCARNAISSNPVSQSYGVRLHLVASSRKQHPSMNTSDAADATVPSLPAARLTNVSGARHAVGAFRTVYTCSSAARQENT